MFAAVFIPNFALQAILRQEPELRSRPLALIDPALSKPIIIQLTAAAQEHGVVEGLTASQAMARCGDLSIKTRSFAQEQSATSILLQTAYAFSPNIEATAPGVCTMELKGLGLDGPQKLQAWAERIVTALATLELAAQIGIASTPALAWLAAHDAHPIQLVSHSESFASLLPIGALQPSPEIAEVLERWGIRTVGALLQLGKAELTERLGPEILPLLDQVSPHSVRPLKLAAPKQTFEEEVEFENEIETAEPLLFVLHRFTGQLVKRLELLHLVVAQLELKLKLTSGAVYERQFRIPAPTGDIRTLFRALQTHLETVRTDAPITALRLEARPCRPEIHQFGLFETTLKDPNQFAETLARLTALCGSDRVGTPVPELTHRPDVFEMREPQFDGDAENAALTPALSRPAGEGEGDPTLEFAEAAGTRPNAGSISSSPVGREKAGVRAKQAHNPPIPSSPIPTALPLRRFRPPLAAFVELRDQQPALIRSEVFNGAILDSRGPFRTSGDWWDRQTWSREEWDVQTADGTLFRVFRADGEFFVEGIYD